MALWIQVHTSVTTHNKTFALAEKLHTTRFGAIGVLVSLWSWASINALDGDLTNYSARGLADGLCWRKGADLLYNSLVAAGFIDKLDDGKIVLHNWEKHANLLIDMEKARKEKINARVRRHREKKKCNVSETACNPPTQTNPNQPNPTQTNSPLYLSEERTPLPPQNSLLPSGGDGGDFRLIAEYLSKRQLNLADYLGAGAVLEEVDRYTKSAMMLWNRRPAPLDNVRVFLHGTTWDGENRQVDGDKMDLLLYAMEQALNAGKAGNWNYVEGVLANLYQRDIQTVAQAEDYTP